MIKTYCKCGIKHREKVCLNCGRKAGICTCVGHDHKPDVFEPTTCIVAFCDCEHAP